MKRPAQNTAVSKPIPLIDTLVLNTLLLRFISKRSINCVSVNPRKEADTSCADDSPDFTDEEAYVVIIIKTAQMHPKAR